MFIILQNLQFNNVIPLASWYIRYGLLLAVDRGGARHFHLGGATGGASFATRGAVNGLCRMQWHDVTRKIFGGPGKILRVSGPLWHPPSSAPGYRPMLSDAIGNPERHVRRASHRGSKQQ